MLRSVLGASPLVAPAAATVWGQGMPFHTPTALPLPLAESSIRSFYQHGEMRTLLDNGHEVANPQGLRVDVDAVPLMVPHAVTPGTVVIAGISYLRKTFGQSGTVRTNSGFGDALLMVRHTVLAADFIKGNRRMVLFAGATLPTGETASDSGPLPAPLRLGLGTVNLLGQAVYSYVNDRLGLHGALGYTAATAAKFGVRIGDRLGYDTLFLSPGLQVIPVPNWAIEGSFQLPVVRQLRGTQLGPTWSLALGVRTVLYLVGM